MKVPDWFREAFGHFDPEDIRQMTAIEILAILCPNDEELQKQAAIDFLIRSTGGNPDVRDQP